MITTELQDTAIAFLEAGLALEILYIQDDKEKFAYVMKGKWLNRLPCLDAIKNEESFWNVISDKPFEPAQANITSVRYLAWPTDVDFEDAKNFMSFDDFVNADATFIDRTALSLIEGKLQLQNHLRKNCVESYDAYSGEELQDRCTLIFWPDVTVINETTFQELRNAVVDRYCTFSSQAIPEVHQYAALKHLGLSYKFIDCSDEKLVRAFKRCWFSLIDKEQQAYFATALAHTENEIIHLTEEEKREFEEEATLLKECMQNNIDTAKNKLHTIREIITFWPEMLQPVPSFVYQTP
jgi:hypothetical protein